MYIERHTVSVTTGEDGSATAYSPVVTGRILQVRYVKTDFADGVDFVITADATGETIWSEENVNASATRAPRQATHATDGSASVYAAAGQPVLDHIALARDMVKIAVTNGGTGKVGTFHILVG